MVVISIEMVGEERFIRGMNSYVQAVSDFREVFARIAEDFYQIEERNFSRQGYPAGFQELSYAYDLWKSEHYPGTPIMQLTGRLKDSLTGENQEASQDTIREIHPQEAEFGTLVPYAHRHQMGTGGMPQRKVVQLTEEDKVRWGRIIQGWAYELLRGRPSVRKD